MVDSKIEALLVFILLALVKDKHTQVTAVINPRCYNDCPQCDVTGADGIRWVVDGLLSTRLEIRNHGIRETELIVLNATTGSLRRSISIERNVTNKNTSILCQAESISSAGVSSEPILFKIQGLLDTPSNCILDYNYHAGVLGGITVP